MRIALSAIGSNPAPEISVEGAGLAIKELPSTAEIMLIGDENIIKPLLDKHNLNLANIKVIHASEEVLAGEHPTKALQKPNSDISIGFNLIKNKQADAFCCTGNIAAMNLCASYITKTFPRIIRPAMAGFIPKANGYTIILDAGANTDCKPDVLQQFSRIGSVFAKNMFGLDNPRIALLNLGKEEQNAAMPTEAAAQLIATFEKVNFTGYIQAHDLFSDKADVVICDGFVGNTIIKMAESFYPLMKERNLTDEFIERFNYEIMGFKPILGINGNVITGKPASSSLAVKNMLHLSFRMAGAKIHSRIKEAFGE
jgi:phosphate acyltransferase